MCHRFPPFLEGFPVVSLSQWCGEFQSAQMPKPDDTWLLNLSVRSQNCLESAGITTVSRLCEMKLSDLVGIRGFGKRSQREVMKELANRGLSLRNEP